MLLTGWSKVNDKVKINGLGILTDGSVNHCVHGGTIKKVHNSSNVYILNEIKMPQVNVGMEKKNGIQEKIFAEVVKILEKRKLILKKRNHCRLNLDRSAVFHKESREEARSGSTFDEKGQTVAFRIQGAHRG